MINRHEYETDNTYIWKVLLDILKKEGWRAYRYKKRLNVPSDNLSLLNYNVLNGDCLSWKAANKTAMQNA